MDFEAVRAYCLSKKSVTESLPFDDETLVFKVFNKMFALCNLSPPYRINLKCDPVAALELRERYPAVSPGYHMNKKHWNTVALDGSIPVDILNTWIDQSYKMVAAGFKKSDRLALEKL